MLISMEISLIYRKLLSSALICPAACPSQLSPGGPPRHARLNMGLVCPHTGPRLRKITEAALTSLSAYATTMPFPRLPPLPLTRSFFFCSVFLGFSSHDGFIVGPLAKAKAPPSPCFPSDPFSLVFSTAGIIKDLWVIQSWTRNMESSVLFGSIKIVYIHTYCTYI